MFLKNQNIKCSSAWPQASNDNRLSPPWGRSGKEGELQKAFEGSQEKFFSVDAKRPVGDKISLLH